MESYKNEEMIRQIILEHYESPNYKVSQEVANNLEDYLSYNHKSDSCIDNLTVYLKISDGIVVDAKFSGLGCAISVSSTDIMCGMLINKNYVEIKQLMENYFNMIKNDDYDESLLQELTIFKNVSKQMNRIKCALVGLNSINNIIEKNK